ncbi:hypothetical protein CKO12_12890 [Chromatium okenii]|nr:hypothetical protein [Chromatium okenii]
MTRIAYNARHAIMSVFRCNQYQAHHIQPAKLITGTFVPMIVFGETQLKKVVNCALAVTTLFFY